MKATIKLALALILFAAPALAQTRKPMKLDLLGGLLGKLQNIALADLQAANALALAHQDTVASACYSAWIEYIKLDHQTATNPDGSPVSLPNPHLIYDLQRAFELQRALQPGSPLMLACAPFKQSVLGLMLPIPLP